MAQEKSKKEIIIELLKLLDRFIENPDNNIKRHARGLKKSLMEKYNIRFDIDYEINNQHPEVE